MHRAPQSSTPRARPGPVLAGLDMVVMTLGPAQSGAVGPLTLGGSTAPAAPQAATQVEAVPAADIPLRADIDERFVQEVMRRARQSDPSASLGPRLDVIAGGIASLSKSFTKRELEELSVVRLESLESHWGFYDRELQQWRRELGRITARYSEDAAALAERRAAWEATQQLLAAGGVTGALSNRVAGILADTRLAEQSLSGPLETQIELGRRANSVQSSIDAGHKTIDAAIKNYDRRLATADAAPAWQAWRETEFTGKELRDAGAGLRLEATFLREWSAASTDRIVAYQVTMAMVLALLLWLAHRSRSVVTTEAGMAAASRVLGRPLSAWLVLAFVGLPFFFPDAPVVLHQIALLLALVPVLRLLPPRVYELLGAWPYAATALYVIYRLSFLLLGEPLLYRLYLLAVAVVSAGALVWLLLSSRQAADGVRQKRLRGAVRLVGWLAVAALAAAIAANAAGNVTLAEMLTGGVLDSAYFGFALFAGATVLSSVVSLMLARRAVSRFRVITQHSGSLQASTNRFILLAALLIWIIATLTEFRAARPLSRWLRAVLTHPLEAGQISVTLGSILLFGFAIWIAFWIAKTVRFVLRDEILPKMDLPRGVDNSISTLSYYTLLIVGLMIALAAAGFEATQFALVFGALGVGIGFGLQNVVNNFVSGLILMFERPIQPGDVVEVSGTSGKVREIGMRATTLTTFEGADVVVPNGTLLSEKLINWTLSDMNRRLDVEVGVAYGSDPRRVLGMLAEVARGTPGITTEPAPSVVFLRFGASSLDFSIRAWTHDFADWVSIRTEMTARVYEALRREGIEIPFPQQDLHLRSVSDDAAARLAGSPVYAPPKSQPATEC
jgi:potassium-dependent mechanosensitive channel